MIPGILKRALLRASFAALVLSVLLLTTAWALHRMVLEERVIPRVAELVGEELGLEVTIDDLRLSLSGRVRVLGIHGAAERPATGLERIDIDEVQVDIDLRGLVRPGTPLVSRLRIVRPVLVADLDRGPFLPAGEEVEAEVPEADGSIELPAIEVEGGEARLVAEGEALEFRGVDGHLQGQKLLLRIDDIRGSWRFPRPDAIAFPLEISAVFPVGTDPLADLRVDRVRSGGDLFAEDVRIRSDASGVVRVEGQLPALGLEDARVTIREDRVELRCELEGFEVERGLRLFLGRGHGASARVNGSVRLTVPLVRPEEAWGAVHLSAAMPTYGSLDLAAVQARLDARRDRDGRLDGGAVVSGLRVEGHDPVDLVARLRHRFRGEDAAIEIENLSLFVEGGVVELGGLIVTKPTGIGFEDWWVVSSGLPLRALSAHLGAASMPSGEASVALGFEGGADPTTWDIAGVVDLSALNVPSGPVDISGSVAWRDCRLRWEHLTARRAEDWMEISGEVDAEALVSSAVALHPLRGTLRELAGEVAGIPVFSRDHLSVTWDGHELLATPLHLVVAGTEVAVRTAVEPGGSGEVFVEIPEWKISPPELRSVPAVSDVGFLTDVAPRGRLSARARATFAVRDGEVVEPAATVELTWFRLRARGGAWPLSGVSGAAALRATAERIELEHLEISEGQDRAEASGWLDLGREMERGGLRVDKTASDGPRFHIDATGSLADLGRLPIPSREIRELSGRAEVRLVAEGALDVPHYRLSARVHDAVVQFSGELPSLRDVSGTATLDETGGVELSKISGSIADGTFEMGGSVRLSGDGFSGDLRVKDVDVSLVSEDIRLVRTPDIRVRGDVDLRWSGTWARPRLRGTVDVTRAYYLHDLRLLGEGSVVPFDWFRLETPPLQDLAFDVKVRAARTIRIINNVARTRASANLNLGGTGAFPLVAGTLYTDEGTVGLGNSSLDIESALIEFSERDPYNPRLEATLTKKVRGYNIVASVRGSVSDLEVLLDSSPPLGREKLVVLLATGQTVDQIEQEGVERFAAVEAAKYVGRNLYEHFFPSGDPTEESFWDRFKVETEAPTRSDLEDLIRLEVEVLRNRWPTPNRLFLQSERDWYSDYNFNVGWRFEIE